MSFPTGNLNMIVADCRRGKLFATLNMARQLVLQGHEVVYTSLDPKGDYGSVVRQALNEQEHRHVDRH